MEIQHSYNIIQIKPLLLEDGTIEETRIYVNVLLMNVCSSEEIVEPENHLEEENPVEPGNLLSDRAIVVGATGAGVVAIPVAGTALLSAVGFTSAGIAAGSTAAGIQAGIGSVAAGSTFATLQSIGATGGLAILGPVGLVGGLAIGGITAGFIAYRNNRRRNQQTQNVNEDEKPE